MKQIFKFPFGEEVIKKFGEVKGLKLIFRGSEDGFESKVFHKNCDNQGPTVIIIKSKSYDEE